MFVQVRLLNGFREPLWYQTEVYKDILPGTVVKVPLRGLLVSAIIDKKSSIAPSGNFKIRDVASIESFPVDPCYWLFLQQISTYYFLDPFWFFKRIGSFLKQSEQDYIDNNGTSEQIVYSSPIALTQEQKSVSDAIVPHIINSSYFPALLYGVTASGKTEVYCALIEAALSHNKSALLLLPEVFLAVHFSRLLKQRYGKSYAIYSFHSAVSKQEKKDLWQALLHQKPSIIIGVHLPVTLPISNLGVIIVDEEHDVGYQEKKHPRMNSKEIAIMRAKMYNIPIVLGSATPSISSLYNVEKRGWYLFRLMKRFAGSFPKVELTLLSDGHTKTKRRSFWISTQLEQAIAQQLHKREQTILFINRRGFSFFTQCTTCKQSITCSQCSVTLTVHENNRLVCHYCGFESSVPSICPSCKNSDDSLVKRGIGTQQVATIVQKLFPTARIARIDMDSTVNKKKLVAKLKEIQNQEIDIIIGTQSITKGYHFPHVTLVGVIWADLNLHFPRYNATEVCLQQLIQVAGRAGRQRDGSRVIIQAMADHRIFSYMNEIDYHTFYYEENRIRSEVLYPPVIRLLEVMMRHTNDDIVEREAQDLASLLNAYNKRQDVYILGPAKPAVYKIKNINARMIYIKAPSMHMIEQLVKKVSEHTYQSSITCTPNPLS
jgi:primosomal protein N' (replication factor Y)